MNMQNKLMKITRAWMAACNIQIEKVVFDGWRQAALAIKWKKRFKADFINRWQMSNPDEIHPDWTRDTEIPTRRWFEIVEVHV